MVRHRPAADHRARFLIFGAVLMVIWYLAGHREFFRTRTEVAVPEAL
jgi:hypothetical protein